MSTPTFYSRVNSWYARGYTALVNCIKSDASLLPPIRRTLKDNQIEYHNVTSGAGHSIYVKSEDRERAEELTAHLPKHWYEGLI